MSERIADGTRSLGEIETQPTVAATFWLEQGEAEINGRFNAGYAEKHPAMLVGFMSVCAAVYAAERQVDAANRIRDGLLAVADVLQGQDGSALATSISSIAEAVDCLAESVARAVAILDTMAPPRFKGKPSRFVEPGEGA